MYCLIATSCWRLRIAFFPDPQLQRSAVDIRNGVDLALVFLQGQSQRVPAEGPLARRVAHGKPEVVDQGGPGDALGLILLVTGAPDTGKVSLTERGSGCQRHPQE